MHLKDDSVNITNLCKPISDRLQALDVLTQEVCGTELVITSGNDGKHMADSLHYSNRAVDVRTFYIPPFKRLYYLVRIQSIFPNADFDIVDEGDHIHIEYDPR